MLVAAWQSVETCVRSPRAAGAPDMARTSHRVMRRVGHRTTRVIRAGPGQEGGGGSSTGGSGRFCSSAAALAVLEVTDHREDGVGDDEAAEEDVRDLLPLVSLGCKFRSARVWLGVGPGGPGPGARPRTDSLLDRVPAHHADALRGRAKEPCTGHRERHGCQLQKGNKRDLTGHR